jgi:hypothetical protein
MTGTPLDVVCLVADENMRQALLGMLSRHQALGIRQIRHDIPVHPLRDPGCRTRSPDFLQTYLHRASHALVLFDHEGCGRDPEPREAIEVEVEARLHRSGWGERAAVIVIDPELESWVWSDSPHVSTLLGWADRTPDLLTWLRQHENKYLDADHVKPARPKEAVEAVLRTVRQPRSSVLYRELARKVSLERCTDPAFGKLSATLQRWFAEESARSRV